MKRYLLVLTAVSLFTIACAQTPTTAPTTIPTSGPTTLTTTSQATTTSAPAAEVIRVLKLLEGAGKSNLSAKVDYIVDLMTTGDTETRAGAIQYQADPQKFRIAFDTVQVNDEKLQKKQVEYAFDGQWFTVSKFDIKNMTKYQVVPQGQKAEPLKLGQGPFPLPVGQATDDVLKYFVAVTRDLRKGEPAGSLYVELTTRPQFEKEFNFRKLEAWVDPKTGMPIKIVSYERNKNIVTVTFKDAKTAETFKQEIFASERPQGWEYTVEPLKKP